MIHNTHTSCNLRKCSRRQSEVRIHKDTHRSTCLGRGVPCVCGVEFGEEVITAVPVVEDIDERDGAVVTDGLVCSVVFVVVTTGSDFFVDVLVGVEVTLAISGDDTMERIAAALLWILFLTPGDDF